LPRLSRYFVQSSLVCLALSFTISGLILAAKGGVGSALVWVWLPAHIVLALNGWLIQLAIGVAYWIFPRILLGDRGRPHLAWAAFIMFQTGIALVMLSLLQIWWPPAAQLLAPGIVLQVAAVLLFVGHAWPRVRAAFIRTQSESTKMV
jgi:hypothetical protein